MTGSSPRVWGQVSSRTSEDFRGLQRRDHPHACGDKVFCVKCFRVKVGSSPRVWGQAWAHGLKTATGRIIPTRVGTRTCTDWELLQEQDHPHACGDKSLSAKLLTPTRGSSPRVWGQVIEDIFIDLAHGIIPTRMGTSEASTSSDVDT